MLYVVPKMGTTSRFTTQRGKVRGVPKTQLNVAEKET